jgi:hypothetical protein
VIPYLIPDAIKIAAAILLVGRLEKVIDRGGAAHEKPADQ